MLRWGGISIVGWGPSWVQHQNWRPYCFPIPTKPPSGGRLNVVKMTVPQTEKTDGASITSRPKRLYSWFYVFIKLPCSEASRKVFRGIFTNLVFILQPGKYVSRFVIFKKICFFIIRPTNTNKRREWGQNPKSRGQNRHYKRFCVEWKRNCYCPLRHDSATARVTVSLLRNVFFMQKHNRAEWMPYSQRRTVWSDNQDRRVGLSLLLIDCCFRFCFPFVEQPDHSMYNDEWVKLMVGPSAVR